MNPVELKAWIDTMLYSVVRRGESGVRFERCRKTRVIQSSSQNGELFGAIPFQDWGTFTSLVKDPKRLLALHRFLREKAELSKKNIPDEDMPEMVVHSNDTDLIWCSFVRSSPPPGPESDITTVLSG